MAERHDDAAAVRIDGLTENEMVDLIKEFTWYMHHNTVPPGVFIPDAAVLNFVRGKFALVTERQERIDALLRGAPLRKDPPHNGTIPEDVNTNEEAVLAYWATRTGCDAMVHLQHMSNENLHDFMGELSTLIGAANHLLRMRQGI